MDLILQIKEKIALKNGYRDDILGTAWEYAMQLTHRTKKQIQLYEELACALAELVTCESNALSPDVRYRTCDNCTQLNMRLGMHITKHDRYYCEINGWNITDKDNYYCDKWEYGG